MKQNQIILGDCLEVMSTIPDNTIDLILCDLPYGTTTCSWDTIISFDVLWSHYERLITPKGTIVLTATQPFTSALIMSNPKLFKYSWVWKKSRPGGFVNAKLKPLKATEDICVFSKAVTANGSKNNMLYNPQGLIKVDKEWKRPTKYDDSEITFSRPSHNTERVIEYTNYPNNILEFANPNTNVLHPTQKPVPLFEYLIKTYTNEGMTVLDNCAGSMTTAIAAINTNRNYICIEKEEKYYNIGINRVAEHQKVNI